MPASVTAPTSDRGTFCADVGEVRACWGPGLTGDGCERGVCAAARPLPEAPRPLDGWRCEGMNAKRTCAPGARGVEPWQCDERACLQRHPRLPDQGECDCAELDGVGRCAGGLPAAGVPEGPADLGWLCGPRSGGSEERVCVDFAPDVPVTAERDRWRCKFLRREGLSRSCERLDKPMPRVGSRCGDASACPKGAVCAGGACLPPWPKPGCYLDDDCGGAGACRFGTCGDGG